MEDFYNNPQKVEEDVPNFFRAKSIEESGFSASPFNKNVQGVHFELEQEAIKNEKNIFEKFLAKLFPKIYKIRKIKIALKKLNNLNITVREMVEKNTDDETQDKHYKILSNYINKANEIQSELKKEI